MLRRSIRFLPVLLLALLLWFSGPLQAQSGINVILDNTPVTFDQPPVMIGGSVMVPMRGVFERLGADVVYDGATRTIRATHGQTIVELGLGQPTARINGQVRQLTTPAMSVGGRTMVPLRFVSEALGADVRWSPASRTVAITTTGGPAPGPGPGYPQPTPPVTYGQPHIYSVVTSATNGLHAGDNVQVTMQGDPGGQASFDLTGVFNNIPMTEQSPGRYVGTVQVPYNANLANAQIIGRLSTSGGQAVYPVNVAAGPPMEAPGFRHVHPEENSVVQTPRPAIHVHVGERDELVPSSVRVLLNGVDVTRQADVSLREITFQPATPLPNGVNTVFVQATDAQGNRLQKQWNFTVQGGGNGQGEGLIQSVTLNATQPLPPGQVLTVTMLGTPGGQADFDIGNYRRDIPMSEVAPGRYVGSYQVQGADNVQNVQVVAHLQANGEHARHRANVPVSLGFGAPGPGPGFGALFVQLSAPAPNMPVPDQFIIAGTTRPGATVSLVVRVDTGGMFNFQGNVLNTQVVAGTNGTFQYPFQGSLPFHGGTYVITATASDPTTGQQSPPATVNVPRAQ